MMSREDASSFKLRQLATKQDAYRGYTNLILSSRTRDGVFHVTKISVQRFNGSTDEITPEDGTVGT
jgi:hypothetical protein